MYVTGHTGGALDGPLIGGTDVFLREMVKFLGPNMGVNFVVENVRGGSGAKAMAKLAKAALDLESKTPTRPSDELQPKLEAERAFRSGMVLLLQNMLPGAEREFVRAAELQPGEPEYRMYEAWVGYLTARGEEKQTLARAKAQACASRVLQDHKESSRAHSILGQLANSRGELDAADRHFRMALRYDPNDRDAQRGLRLLVKRKPSA